MLLIALLSIAPLAALAWAYFDLFAFLAFATLGIVKWEPAPVDLLITFLLGLGFLAGRLSPDSLRGSLLIHAGCWIFATLNLVALLVADDLRYSLRYTAITFYLIALSYFVKLYVTSSDRMRVLMLGYVGGAVASVLLVGLQMSGVLPTRELFVFENRARALFKDANVFAPFLVLPIVFLIDELIRPELIRRGYWLKIAAIAALSSGVFLSFSRAAWANLILSVMIYMLLTLPSLSVRQWLQLFLPGISGAVLLVVLVVQLQLLDFLRSRATLMQSYDVDRFSTQAEGIEAGLSHLFGIGPGMLFNAHSLYVRTFAEYGIFGLVTLLALILALVGGSLWRALGRNDRVYGLSSRVVVACWIGLLLNSVVIDTIHWRYFWVMFALGWIMTCPSTLSVRGRAAANGV
ncbi:MAG: hypothetical protein RMK84_17350 [Oscillochloridaceae bacterium]|nr:hypothetical protein [Chloroflexaceae bacterium]MDW8391889.1 hypothetical protein [Oscillochloridaceae bacterium]